MAISTDLAIGVWSPDKLIGAAKQYMQMTYAPGELALFNAGHKSLRGLGAMPQPTVQPDDGAFSSGASETGAALAVGAVAVGLLLLLGLRVGASWYVGKQFGRPTSGAIVGGIFGAPGLGVLSLFPSNKKAK